MILTLVTEMPHVEDSYDYLISRIDQVQIETTDDFLCILEVLTQVNRQLDIIMS